VLRSWSAVIALPLLALVLVLGGGCSADESGQPTPSSSWVPDDPSVTEDQPGMLACGALSAALNDGTLMAAGVADAIVTSAGSADAPIADAAQRLRRAYNSATVSHGTDGEPDAVAAVSAAGLDMLSVCDDSGLKTVG
jgi:hypothetical protein